LIDELDVPISESAVVQIRQTGAKIRTVSRWLNAVSVEASIQQLQRVNALPIVSHCEPVVQFKRPHPLQSSALPPSLAKIIDRSGAGLWTICNATYQHEGC